MFVATVLSMRPSYAKEQGNRHWPINLDLGTEEVSYKHSTYEICSPYHSGENTESVLPELMLQPFLFFFFNFEFRIKSNMQSNSQFS